MSNQLRSQFLGITLAITTAIGCVAYERLVKSFSYRFVVLFVGTSYLWLFLGAMLMSEEWRGDWAKLAEHRWSLVVYYLSGVSSIFWYWIVKKQNVMVGSLYEVKYIVVLAVFYAFFGTGRLTWNTLLGVVLASASIYFISK